MSLISKLAQLRESKKTLSAEIAAVEKELLKSAPVSYEGTVHADGFDVVYKVNRKIDWAEYDLIVKDLPPALQCKTMKPQLDLKAFRHLQAADPVLAAIFCTETDGKPAINIIEE